MEWIALAIVGLIIILLNGILLRAFWMNKSLLNKPPNHLFCNLSASDILTGLLFVPFQISEMYHPNLHVTPYMVSYIFFTSLLCLFTLTWERYLAVTKPTLHFRTSHALRARNVVAVCWLCPLIPTLIPLAWQFLDADKKVTHASKFSVSLCVIISLFCIVMICMYLEMFIAIRRFLKRSDLDKLPDNQRAKSLSRMEVRIVVLLTLYLAAFLLAYIPILYINLTESALRKPQLITAELVTFSLYTFLLNSVFNPLMALALKKDIRESVRDSLPVPCIKGRISSSGWRTGFMVHKKDDEGTIALENVDAQGDA